jgi:hypothetical protein
MHKAYDRVEWRFLENMLIHLGFPQNFVELMMACVRSVKYKVRYNDQERQGEEVHSRQCPCLRAFDSWSVCGHWQIRRLQTEIRVHRNLPRFSPPEGKDLYPACLILYCLYNWSCYNGAQMGSGYGQKRDGVC